MENLELYADEAIKMAIAYAPKLLLAIVTLIVGFWVIGSIVKLINKIMTKRNLDPALHQFLGGILSITLKIALVISVMGMVGIEMTSFVAILGAAGLAVGMALSGTLQNFAGGVLILILKPFKIGDFVEMQGHMGTVTEIQIFNTILLTPDNKKIIIPNSPISTGSLTNFSAMPTRRVDFTFGIGYNDDIDKAKAVLFDIIKGQDKIMGDPAPFVAVSELADSSVNFVVRVWVNAPDYWDVYFYMNETVKKTFDKEGISIPYPQMDVHVDK